MGEFVMTRRGGKSIAKLTQDATATAADIASGKTAYAKGEKVAGTAAITKIASAQSETITVKPGAASSITISVPSGYAAYRAILENASGSNLGGVLSITSISVNLIAATVKVSVSTTDKIYNQTVNVRVYFAST